MKTCDRTVIRVEGGDTASGGTPDARLAITVQTGNLEQGMEAVKLLLTGTLRRNRGRASQRLSGNLSPPLCIDQAASVR